MFLRSSKILLAISAFCLLAGTAFADSISFQTTQTGNAPLTIDPALFDSPGSQQFLATGKNPYIGDANAIARGKKIFQLYSCTQCHGPEGNGQVGPNLHGPDFHYAKNTTNKGMFETIWAGTSGGMGAKGYGLMSADDGLSPDDVLKVIAWIRSDSKITGNE